MSHGTQDEYYTEDEYHDAPDLFNDVPPDGEPPDDDGECSSDCEDEYEDNGRNDLYYDDCLYRCVARFKGHEICNEIFSTARAIEEHLRYTHKTQKWLVNTYVRST